MPAVPNGSSTNWYYGLGIRFYDANNSNYAGIFPPSNITANVDYTLPAAGPAADNYYLRSTMDGQLSWVAAPGTGTVTSVAATVPSFMAIGGSPITTSGTLAFTFSSQSGNKVLCSPSDGSSGTPDFRVLVAADIPNLSANKITTSVLNKARLFDAGSGSGSVQTTTSSPTVCYSFTPDDDTIVLVTAWVSAIKTDGTVGAAFVLEAAVRRHSSVTLLSGTTPVLNTFNEVSSLTWTATIDVSSPVVRVLVTGTTTQTINWKADVICTLVAIS